jgi:type IV pilus assembly protein PilA
MARRRQRQHAFTLVELMTVVAVLAVLATLALPSIQGKLVRDQIIEGAKLADVAKLPVAAAWSASHVLPVDNTEAGLPAADRIVGNLVSSVAVEAGAVQLTFGNHANGALAGKVLSLRPAVVEDAPVVPVAWVCGNAAAPLRMTVHGVNRTTIPAGMLPLNCRAG